MSTPARQRLTGTALRETGDPTTLDVGDVGEGQVLGRVGSTVAGVGGALVTGWPVAADGTPSVTTTYDPATRKVTINATSGSTITVYHQGLAHTEASPHVSAAHTATTGNWFYYWDGSAWVWSQTAWDLMRHAPAALAYYRTTGPVGVGFVETHTTSRTPALHRRLHEIDGTALVSGGVLSGYTLNTASDAAVTFAISECVIADEDLHTTIAALSDAVSYTIWYRSGADGEWAWTTNTLPWAVATYPKINTFSAGTWDLRALGAKKWGVFYVLATPAMSSHSAHGFVIVPSQTEYSTQAAATAETFASLSLSTLPSQEFVPIAKLVIDTGAGYGGTSKAKIQSVTRLTGTRVNATTASVAQHNALSGIQGGAPGDYRHLTQAEYDALMLLL